LSHEMMKSRERRLSLMAERNMCSVVKRVTVVPPGSENTSRAKGSRRNLGDPAYWPSVVCVGGPHRKGEEP